MSDAMTEQEVEQIISEMAINIRNSTLDTAAQVAKLNGAPDAACVAILALSNRPIGERRP